MSSPAVTKATVETALTECLDPELGIDIVSLGLIYDIIISPSVIAVTMTLTTPGCPLVPYFKQDIIDRVKKATAVPEVKIDVTFNPPWSPERMSAAAKSQLTMLRG